MSEDFRTYKLKDLSGQEPLVIRELMRENKGMLREDAVRIWEHSKTKAKLEKRKLFYVSAMRIVWELNLELTNDDRWFDEPFDM